MERKDKTEKKKLLPKKINLPRIGGKVGEKIKSAKKFKLTAKVKKNIIVAASVVLIGGAIVLNWYMFADGAEKASVDITQDRTATASNDAADDYFTTTQISRQRARDESIEVLQSIVYSEEAVDDVKNEAWEDITKIARNIEAEANIETLVVSKGIEECVAVVSDESATVIVKSDDLRENQITQIQEIVYEQANIPVENLKIVQK